MKNRMLLALPLAAALVVGGCTSARPMMVPSGSQGFKIWCELPSQCYDRAAKTCPYGYEIEANEKNYLGFGDVDGNLFITCKQPQQARAAIPPVPATPGSAPAGAAPASGSRWWNEQKPAAAEQPAATRYRCTDVDGNPYVTTTPTKGCMVE